ncbi:DUF1194 domain-containing protein [uncultured Amaricoccus sp.]|uniref:DUF1194 domain-containing protein n=1 Tax=uncultured Amaricoccus sp. TaxID=339341 RepID=UPI002621F052|nr:DUF1194 domain-containing protein [uncultured Amaricoccus sp.]
MRALLGLALALGGPLAGAAAAQDCRIALSLGLDVSSSVDAAEYRLQTEGLARALVAPEVVAAFLGEPGRTVTLQVYEWSGRGQQVVRQDWVPILGEADLARVAGRLLASGRGFSNFPTALGEAMAFGALALADAPDCVEHKLDISGDGTSNDGISPSEALARFPFDRVTVNGLVIGSSREALARYYQRFVIHGPGAFVEAATDYSDFEQAMRRKLERELQPGRFAGR